MEGNVQVASGVRAIAQRVEVSVVQESVVEAGLSATEAREPARVAPRWMQRRWRMAGMLAGGCALVALLWLTWFTLSLRADYRATKANIDAVRAMFAPDGNTGELRPEQLPELAERLGTIELQIRNLDARLDVPVLTPVARHLPWFGPRLRAVEQFLAFGVNASDLAHDGANLGNDIYAAWELTGFSGDVDPNAPTWLSAVQANRGQIDTLLLRFDELLQERDALDDEHLPEQATSMLASLDPLMQRAARVREAYVGWLDYYPLIEQALGAREDGRYIVLLLNSQEIRPVGGFPGTYAVITVREGRLFDYTFHNILELDGAYLAARSKPIPAPAPLRRYLEVRELLPRDSGWDPDFPHMAARLLEMYALTGGEPVHGVVAVTDIAVRDVLRSLGPMTVYIQGEPVTVTGDNVVQTIEAYRLGPGERHKDAVRVIGSALLDRIRNGGFAVQRDVLSAMRASADRREIQFYAVDPTLQAEVVARGWDGALVPDPAQPTLGLTLANIVGNKASHNLTLAGELHIAQTADGTTRLTWDLLLTHHGNPGGNQFYNGFHRTWLALYLPTGSTVVHSDPEPTPPPISDDPRALGYHLELYSGESLRLRVTFDLPAGTDSLRLRRQPGANPIALRLSGVTNGCAFNEELELAQDALLDLTTCEVQQPAPRSTEQR